MSLKFQMIANEGFEIMIILKLRTAKCTLTKVLLIQVSYYSYILFFYKNHPEVPQSQKNTDSKMKDY